MMAMISVGVNFGEGWAGMGCELGTDYLCAIGITSRTKRNENT